MSVAKPAVRLRCVHAEPGFPCELDDSDEDTPITEVGWLALWPNGTITWHRSAGELLREVRQRDRREAHLAQRRGESVVFVTAITWNDVPPGFVPPASEACSRPARR